jgi:hypothetical protein
MADSDPGEQTVGVSFEIRRVRKERPGCRDHEEQEHGEPEGAAPIGAP